MPSSTFKPSLRDDIVARARAERFDVVRFSPASAPPLASERLERFLEIDRHGTMDWMRHNAERRGDPLALWPAAKTIIVLGINYAPDHDPLASLAMPDRGAISVYAQGADYHDVIKKRLRRVAGYIAESYKAEVKLFVDTAPVMEKPIAQVAGVGWQGKHTNLVSREFGSWLFLASIFTTLEIETDLAEVDHCGACRRCLDICPTHAFPAPYELDARRCISYLTIEHKGHIPREFRAAIGNRIYGCDDCLAVCPWNKFARTAHASQFHPRLELKHARLAELARVDDTAFRSLFRGSPVKRIGRDRFVRNVLIAIGNSGELSLAREALRLLDDASPLVRAMAVWALGRLNALPKRHEDVDEAVRSEWEYFQPAA
jgi:epoxyqueuosine reductase